MYAKIEPIIIPIRGAACIMRLVARVAPGQNATIEYTLWTEEYLAVMNGIVEMPKDVYEQWGTDDAFLYTWAAGVLGLTIVEIVNEAHLPPPPAPVPEPVDPPAPPAV